MNPNIEYDWAAHDAYIRMHYDHAREKHPYFCDKVNTGFSDEAVTLEEQLDSRRRILENAVKYHTLRWPHLLSYKMTAASLGIANGDTAAAVEELYECVAVCLRAIDVLEGRQKLGKLETKGDAV